MRAWNWNVTDSKKIFSTWLFPDFFRYDSPKKCPTILYAVNLWLKPVSAIGATQDQNVRLRIILRPLNVTATMRYSTYVVSMLKQRKRQCTNIEPRLDNINPLSPHDAMKHHITSLKTDLIFLHPRVLEWEFQRNWFTNTWQFSLIFKPHQTIFIHYKSRIATAIRGL